MTTIQEGPGRISVNGQADHDEVAWVGQQVHDVWDSWSWLVEDFPTDHED